MIHQEVRVAARQVDAIIIIIIIEGRYFRQNMITSLTLIVHENPILIVHEDAVRSSMTLVMRRGKNEVMLTIKIKSHFLSLDVPECI